jgi:voltage-gated potassium channel
MKFSGFKRFLNLRLKRVLAFLFSHQLLLLLLITIFFVLLGGFTFFFIECGKNQSIHNPFDAIWWVIVTMSTVGYGDIYPSTTAGRVVGIFMMFIGVAFMGTLSATIASSIIGRDIKGGLGLLSVDVRDHVVVCGWNHQASRLIEDMMEDLEENDRYLVILANLPSKPIEHERITFVKGDCTNEVDLRRANIAEARTALVLSDTSNGSLDSADARVILTTLAIETIKPEIYTRAEVINSKNAFHLKNAHVDEIIPGGEFSGRLMAKTAVSPGLSQVISEILTPNVGSDLFKIPISEIWHGKSFDDCMLHLRKSESPIILIAIERNKKVFVNPGTDFVIEPGDNAIIISKQKPEEDL